MASKGRGKQAQARLDDGEQLGLDLQAAAAPAPEPAAIDPKPAALPAFARLVTGASVALGIEQAFAAEGARVVGAPSPEIDAAWKLATEPAKFTALAMVGLGRIWEGHAYNQQGVHWDALSQGVFADFDPSQMEAFCQGLDALAGDIRLAASSAGFQASGRAGAKLLVSASSQDLLSYPALGVALAPASAIVEGKKSPTVAGVKTQFAGSMLGDEEAHARDDAARRREWEIRLGDAPGEADAKEIKAAVSLSKAYRSLWLDFGAVGAKQAAAQAYLSGEVPLPSASLYAEAARESGAAGAPGQRAVAVFVDDANWGRRHGYRHRTAKALGHNDSLLRAEYSKSRTSAVVDAAFGGWAWALSAALSAEKPGAGGAGHDRAKRLRLNSGLLDQLGDAPRIDMAGHASVITPAIVGRLKIQGNERNYHGEDDGEKTMRFVGYALAKIACDPEKSSEAARKASAGKARGLSAAIASGPKGGMGTLASVAESLAKADPRVGLFQVAGALVKARESHQPNPDAARWGNQAEIAVPKEPLPRIELLEAALDSVASAALAARQAYCDAAVARAAEVESAWMARHGLGKAWEQAGQAGPRSPKSVGWAMANPIGESMASEDPMVRLAAQCARGLGLRAKAGDAELAASLAEELAEMGASAMAIEGLARQPGMRSIVAGLATALAGVDKKKAWASRQALGFACGAMNAAAAVGMSDAELERFAADYLVDDAPYIGRSHYRVDKLDLFSAGVSGQDGRFDGMGPGLSSFGVGDVAMAKLAGDVCRAKLAGYPRFVESLAKDWRGSTQKALDLGQPLDKAWEIAASRAAEVRSAFPSASMIDWRKDPFGAQELWQVFTMPSPRFSAAAADAVAKGGELGAWCAARARRLGVHDASDGNDLVARARDKIKQRCDMPDGAWRMAIKDPAILAVVTKDLMLDPQDSNHAIDKARLSMSACFDDREQNRLSRRSPDSEPSGTIRADRGRITGVALKAASGAGISPATAGVVLVILAGDAQGSGRYGRYELFADNIAEVVARGAEGADFFIAEAAEKAARMPKIFLECCRRFDKLAADAAKEAAKAKAAPARAPQEEGREVRGGVFDPAARLAEEVGDLCDWIGESEHGLWSELPKDPTFGQLSRMSKAWHDEQAAIAIDKADRQRVARAVADAVLEADAGSNPYAPGKGSRWGKLLGRHSRDGWEAVEMLTAAELTEEGAAMHHCVSNYSPQCRSGQSRIFSVRLNGERKCTLELQGGNGESLSTLDAAMSFKIVQNKGPSNQSVGNAGTLAFCQEVLEKASGAWPGIVRRIEKAREEKSDAKKDVAKKAREEELARIGAERVGGAPKL